MSLLLSYNRMGKAVTPVVILGGRARSTGDEGGRLRVRVGLPVGPSIVYATEQHCSTFTIVTVHPQVQVQ